MPARVSIAYSAHSAPDAGSARGGGRAQARVEVGRGEGGRKRGRVSEGWGRMAIEGGFADEAEWMLWLAHPAVNRRVRTRSGSTSENQEWVDE
eukprot:4700500-Pleurochrysis_carterae.AAC.1